MAMLRILQIEAEIGDVVAAIQSVMGAARSRPESVAVVMPPALPVPQRNRKIGLNRRNGPSSAVTVAQTPGLSVSEVIRQAIREKPRTNQEILDYLLSRGYKVNSKDVMDRLCYLRSRNEVYKDDRTLAWRPAEK